MNECFLPMLLGSLLLLTLAGCQDQADTSATSKGDGTALVGSVEPDARGGDSSPPTVPDGDQPDGGRDSAGPTQATGGKATAAGAASTKGTSAGAGKALDVSFDDLIINIQADIVFRPWMLTDRAKELDGQKVRIGGYMHGGVSQTKGISEFILLRNTECKFGPGGQADHLIQVALRDGVTTSFTDKVIYVEGILTIRPFEGPDGNTWSIYDLAGEAVATQRR